MHMMLSSLSLNQAARPISGTVGDVAVPGDAGQVVVLERDALATSASSTSAGDVGDVPLGDGVAGLAGELGLVEEERRPAGGRVDEPARVLLGRA